MHVCITTIVMYMCETIKTEIKNLQQIYRGFLRKGNCTEEGNQRDLTFICKNVLLFKNVLMKILVKVNID